MIPRKVVLVGWDAADWKVIQPLVRAGKMPNVKRLVESGASGQIATLHPPLSPMLWTSIATGKRPFKHGILGFSEPAADGQRVQPVTNLSRKSKAIWNILNQNNLRSVVIGWWPSHPAEPINGVMVSDHFHRASGPIEEPWPLLADAVYPPELAGTLAGLRVHPDALAAETVERFIPLARDIDQDKDKRLGGCMRTLAECMSIQAAAMWLMENRPWDFFAVYFDSIDHFCHGFMKYHPPRQSWIGEADFELYRGVVSAAYESHDRMLGALLEKAGEETVVILMSDHGFHPDHLRPASIPDIPAGPAIEHRDFGILALHGPGIARNQLLDGPSVLDIAPTILTLYGLPVGQDMDGKVLSQAFSKAPKVALLPSWEEVPGADGRHPPHTRLDPVAAHEALEQMIALGYIERPDENRRVAVEKTIHELQYNLSEAYQDDDRHIEAYRVLSELHASDPNEQRFAVKLFVSCQALGMHHEMRRIVDDLDSRRRTLFEEAPARIDTLREIAAARVEDTEANPGLAEAEKRDLARWRNLARYQPAVVDYLKAQVLTAEKRYPEALAALQQVTDANLVRPGPLLQTADLYIHMRRWGKAREVYENALKIDPDNAQAYLGLCRLALRKKNFDAAARSALDALDRVYRYPQAHFLLGLALTGMKQYERAADAFRAAISFNSNFPEAHMRLAALLERHLDDSTSSREHKRLARRMRRRKIALQVGNSTMEIVVPVSNTSTGERQPLEDSLIVVTGLPRSGTSMLMQMLAAAGMDVLSDGLRQADEDNPRGYLEFEPVKNLINDSKWLCEGRGKVIKIVAPLLTALPPGLPCRVILCERDLDEVLDSQEKMLVRRNRLVPAAPERRRMLKEEYIRTLARVEAMLTRRPRTQLMVINHRTAIAQPAAIAEKVNRFLGGALDVEKMATVIDPSLHRNRSPRRENLP